MKYKRLFAMVLLLLTSITGLYAQESILASGGEAIGSGGSSSYSVGQMVYATIVGSSGSTSEGVQNSYEISTILGADIKRINLEITAYPNPTTEYLNLTVKESQDQKLTYQLFNIKGDLLDSNSISANGNSQIEMVKFPSSTYFIKVYNADRVVKTFKVIKN